MMLIINEEDINSIVYKLKEKITTIKEDHPNPIGVSHANTKQDAYYNGMKAGINMTFKVFTEDVI
jgi:hypothetical protein